MSENLKPCPRCGSAVQRFSRYVACASTECAVIGPNDDPYGAKWNALPRHTYAAPGMTDGELIARVLLLGTEHAIACVRSQWASDSAAELIAELDRRAALRNEAKP